MLTYEYLDAYRLLRARGASIRGAHRTLKRGVDAVNLAVALYDALGQDGATAVLAGLLGAPYGAQRAAAVLRKWVKVEFPRRNTGNGVHAGAFYYLLRRALKAVPYVGGAFVEPHNIDPKIVLSEAISLLKKVDIYYLSAGDTAFDGRINVKSRRDNKYSTTWEVFVAPPCGGKVLLVIDQERTWDYTEHAFVVRALVYTRNKVIKFPNNLSVLYAAGHATVA
ncbi:MAG: hypothetical protein PWQ39_497 [Thermacetogenium sp.]|nr:hypothetical protein [Thermacetogenium sp.]